MKFLFPEWLLLLPVLFFAAKFLPQIKLLTRPLRIVAVVLLCIALAEPQFRMLQDGTDLWVLADVSDSCKEKTKAQLDEWLKILNAERENKDKIIPLTFANAVGNPNSIGQNWSKKETAGTRIPLALQYVIANRDKSRSTKILLLSDGISTESFAGTERNFQNAGTPIFFRNLSVKNANDLQIDSIKATDNAISGQPFLIETKVSGVGHTAFNYELLRGEDVIAKGKSNLQDGHEILRFSQTVNTAGSYAYSIRIFSEKDPIEGNNFAKQWVNVQGGETVLLVTQYPNDPLEKALLKHGFPVVTVRNTEKLSSGTLAHCRAVILNNVPATDLPREFLNGLKFYVEEEGGGLMICGGKKSFSSGGYFDTKLADVLPVSMEMKQENRLLAVNIALVMDRSGSMGMTVPGGMTKMDLANAGAKRTVELLGYNDKLSVLAVDTEPHVIVELAPVGVNREPMMQAVSRITSSGGGIFVYNGLNKAWEILSKSENTQSHIILFSDAGDSEEPGDYKKLIAEILKNKCTLSVIALGTESDPDANLLKDIAKEGSGRIFFTNDARELPEIFAQEIMTVASANFVEEKRYWIDTGRMAEIGFGEITSPSFVDGYNFCYAKESASVLAITDDEDKTPLVAVWQKGNGRSAAITFPTGGEFSQNVCTTWSDYASYFSTLTQWLAGTPKPNDVLLKSQLSGNTLQLYFYYPESRENEIRKNAPVAKLETESGIKNLAWKRVRPGIFETSTNIDIGSNVRGVVSFGKAEDGRAHQISFGPFEPQTRAEWTKNEQLSAELSSLIAGTGGKEIINLADVWHIAEQPRFKALWQWALMAFLTVFLTEIFLTRIGYKARGSK